MTYPLPGIRIFLRQSRPMRVTTIADVNPRKLATTVHRPRRHPDRLPPPKQIYRPTNENRPSQRMAQVIAGTERRTRKRIEKTGPLLRAFPDQPRGTKKGRGLVALLSPRAKQHTSNPQTINHTRSSEPPNPDSPRHHPAIHHVGRARYEALESQTAAMATPRHLVSRIRLLELQPRPPSSRHRFMTMDPRGQTRLFPQRRPRLHQLHPRPHHRLLLWIFTISLVSTIYCKMADLRTRFLDTFCLCCLFRMAPAVLPRHSLDPTRCLRPSSICSSNTTRLLTSKDPSLLPLDIDPLQGVYLTGLKISSRATCHPMDARASCATAPTTSIMG